MSIFMASGIVSYIMIFVFKMIEVSLATLRVVLNGRGERVKGAAIGFVEVLIWVYVVSSVISNVTEDPIKVFVYCLAFSVGNYLGVTIEGKLAIGTACIQAIVGNECTDDVSAAMREKGYGVTMLKGEGRDGEVDVMLVFLKRKMVDDAINVIRSYSPSAVITVNDVRTLSKGYIGAIKK